MTQQEASEGKQEGGPAAPRPEVRGPKVKLEAAHTEKYYVLKYQNTRIHFDKSITTFEADIQYIKDYLIFNCLTVRVEGKITCLIFLDYDLAIRFI